MAITVSDLARELGCRPRDITNLLYDRVLSDERCPIVDRRRRIPRDYVPTVRKALQARGKLPSPEAAA